METTGTLGLKMLAADGHTRCVAGPSTQRPCTILAVNVADKTQVRALKTDGVQGWILGVHDWAEVFVIGLPNDSRGAPAAWPAVETGVLAELIAELEK